MKTKTVILSNKEIGTIRACMGIVASLLSTEVNEELFTMLTNAIHSSSEFKAVDPNGNFTDDCIFCHSMGFLIQVTNSDWFTSLTNRLALTPEEIDEDWLGNG